MAHQQRPGWSSDEDSELRLRNYCGYSGLVFYYEDRLKEDCHPESIRRRGRILSCISQTGQEVSLYFYLAYLLSECLIATCVCSSMKRLQELLHQVQVPDRALEITNLSSTSSERSHPLRESVRTALVSTSKWRSDRFKLERFDEIMDSLTAVMQYSDRDWDPRVDIEVRKCVLQMQKRSVWITQDDERQARQLILDDWLASLTE